MKPVRIPQDLVVQQAAPETPSDPFMDELMEHVNRIFGDEAPQAHRPLVIEMGSQWG